MIPQRPLGQTGLHVSVLGYGGAPIGFADAPDAAAFGRLIGQALDMGLTFFDTAPDYRRSEEWLGAALRGHRAQVVLATKCGRSQTPTPGGGWTGYEDWSEAGVQASIAASLHRLGTDYLDLVQLHSPPRWVLDDGAALRGLLRAQAAGQVRHLGLSADGADAAFAVEMGVFATLQVSYSILQQEPGDTLLPAAAARGLGLVIKQPVANGIPDLPSRPGHPDWAAKWDVAQRLDWPTLGAPGPRLALALRWVLGNPLVSTAIVGTTDLAHLAANITAAQAPPLPAAQWTAIRAAYEQARQHLTEEQQ